jgi:hypothetical protein
MKRREAPSTERGVAVARRIRRPAWKDICWPRELFDALASVDEARQALKSADDTVLRLLGMVPPRVRHEFVNFYNAGGVTAADWHQWFVGQWRRPPVKARKHLRLVSVRAKKSLRRWQPGDPDAA